MAQRMQAMQAEQQKRAAIRRLMTPEAYDRLANVRISNRELYSQLVDLIIAMAQSNRITSIITEEQLKQILAKFTTRPESSIEFKHK